MIELGNDPTNSRSNGPIPFSCPECDSAVPFAPRQNPALIQLVECPACEHVGFWDAFARRGRTLAEVINETI